MIKKFIIFLAILGCMLNCQKGSIKKKSKQVLRINFYSPPSSFHPYLVCDNGTHTVCKALFEGLTRINLHGETTLAIAKKVKISSCKKVYAFILRPSKWSNGEKVTSHHFARTWKKALSPKSFQAKRFFCIKNAKKFYEGKISFDEVGIRTPSDDRLVVELEHPMPYFLQSLADPLYSPTYDANSEEEPTIFNGPFMVESYDMNKHLHLSANPLYWDSTKVKLEEIQINFIKNLDTAFSMYQEGELDWVGSPFSPIPAESTHFTNIKFKICSSPFWLFCNVQKPVLKSEKIRKALFYALNQKELVKHILIHQKELYTILPEKTSILFPSYTTKKSDIQRLFKEGLQEIGIHEKDFQLTLNHNNTSDYERLASYLKNKWEQIFGVNINLQKDEWNTFYSKIKSGNYGLGGFYVINMCDDPLYFMESFERADTNHTRWENKEYQKLLFLAKNSVDEEERKDHLRKAEEILMNEMPVIPICNRVYTYLCKDNLKNFSPPTFTYSDFKWVYFDD